jgi:Asp/Glu/hydantoin racemase
MSENYPYDAKRRVTALIDSLKVLIAKDPEQEVQGIALSVVDAAVESIKAVCPDDPVVAAVSEIFSADLIGAGEAVRAADLLVVAQQLDAAVGPYPVVIA